MWPLKKRVRRVAEETPPALDPSDLLTAWGAQRQPGDEGLMALHLRLQPGGEGQLLLELRRGQERWMLRAAPRAVTALLPTLWPAAQVDAQRHGLWPSELSWSRALFADLTEEQEVPSLSEIVVVPFDLFGQEPWFEVYVCSAAATWLEVPVADLTDTQARLQLLMPAFTQAR
ncbi:hypothetical protein [Deinococcus hopiensis]|uniref:Uncharacterized protein n=1 Tax=Deinococcus hopiensis KR-140 TaxID=695939 RepID=A0A1W1ULA6_9DEIO|nr:hypothetical protein [Deinococcus hopiensis]SMB81799.1 hypothetical protein SAMN00790413_04725 [Deinococcus hopiensis KR-140]